MWQELITVYIERTLIYCQNSYKSQYILTMEKLCAISVLHILSPVLKSLQGRVYL